jgi:hypothetical protein
VFFTAGCFECGEMSRPPSRGRGPPAETTRSRSIVSTAASRSVAAEERSSAAGVALNQHAAEAADGHRHGQPPAVQARSPLHDSVWVPVIRLPLCDVGVFVEKATESVSSGDLHIGVGVGVGIAGAGERPERAGVVQRPMWPVAVEVGLVLGEDSA